MTKVEIQTCSICSETVVDLERHIMDTHSQRTAPEKIIPSPNCLTLVTRNGLLARRAQRMKILTKVENQASSICSEMMVDMQSKSAPEKTSPQNENERESLFVALDLESTGETPFYFISVVIALIWRNI